ncbi:MAG TPA: ATP-dependent DNA helicase, partial [Acidimicrobiaceae bacterium]|nr:ATP-dependent DNA helicase [Acidimicrobiaceae bacterium]
MDPEAVLAGLDDDQRRAATSPATPLAVVAPAGSGKTRVLTARVAHRVAAGEIEPAHVLCVTFTRKAAGELTGRLRRIGIRDRIEAGTFHAVAWRQLRDRWSAQGRTEPQLLDRVRPFLREQLDVTAPAVLTELANEIGWARARMVRPDGYADAARAAGRR